MKPKIVAVSAVRTPMGKFGGTLKDTPVFHLGAHAIQEAVKRSGFLPKQIQTCLMGCCRQAGNGTNPARTAARLAGLPKEVPATTITMACASGLRAVLLGAFEILAGEANVVVVGGMENMSQMPHLVLNSRWENLAQEKRVVDSWWDSRDPLIEEKFPGSITELLVKKHKITRKEQDAYAFESHQKAIEAQKNGLFREEIAPIQTLHEDETIRKETSLQKLESLPPVFQEDGTLTAGNSSPFADGASALVLTTRKKAKAIGAKPLFSLVAWAEGGVENKWMGEGPAFVLPLALKKAKMHLEDLDFLEVNEAFAGMVLANEKLLKWDRSKLNKKGGALALGHPVGCSGARILVTLYYILKDFQGEWGACAIGGAGGVASALIIQRES
jgi:acetyl-CoA C-acetyltransferase